jgi:hypothetical protein
VKSKTVAAPKIATALLVSGALVAAEFTGNGRQHIEALQEREAPQFVGVASELMVSTANVSAIVVNHSITTL